MTATLYIGNRNYSSWSLRAQLLARQAGLDCEEVLVPLDQPETREQILRFSPSGLVPALHMDGHIVWDSMAICEYLHERFPGRGIWPEDAQARSTARSVCAEMHSGFSALRATLPMDMRAMHPRTTFPDAVAADIRRIEAIWFYCLEQYGSNGQFLFGEWCAADAMYAPVVSRFRTYGIETGEELTKYRDLVWQHAPLQEWYALAVDEPWEYELRK